MRKHCPPGGAQGGDHHRGQTAKQSPTGMLTAVPVGPGSARHRPMMSRGHLSLPLYERAHRAILTAAMHHKIVKADFLFSRIYTRNLPQPRAGAGTLKASRVQLARVDGQLHALVLHVRELLAQLSILDDHGKEIGAALVAHSIPYPAHTGAAGLSQPVGRRHQGLCGSGARSGAASELRHTRISEGEVCSGSWNNPLLAQLRESQPLRVAAG
jgi:hypothetical protein